MLDRSIIHEDGDSEEVASQRHADIIVDDLAEKQQPQAFQRHTDSSITNETPKLKEIEKRILSGGAIDVYELAQNMVSYGSENPQFPPGIIFKLKDGSEVKYSGRDQLLKIQDSIVEISFVSFGQAMAPDDLVTFQHSGGDQGLGVHGRGMTYALSIWTLLKDLDVQVSSHWNGQRYEGKCLAVTGDRPGTKKFSFGYNFDNANEDVWGEKFRETKISVKGEQLDFVINSLFNLDKVFLPANPDYYNATLVDTNPEAAPPLDKQIVWEVDGKAVTVECLAQKKAKDSVEISTANKLFVGGLEVSTLTERYALKWSIWGGEHISSYRKKVTRTEDSLRADGAYSEAIVNLIRKSESKELFFQILEINEGFDYMRSLPFELTQEIGGDNPAVLEMTAQSIAAFKDAVLQKYGSLPLIANSLADATRAQTDKKVTEKIIVSAGFGLTEMFRKIGCEYLSNKLGIEKKETKGELVVVAPDKEKFATILDRVVNVGWYKIELENEDADSIIIVDNPNVDTLDGDSFLRLPQPETLNSDLLYIVSFFDDLDFDVTLKVKNSTGTYTHQFKGSESNYLDNSRGNERGLVVKSESIPDDNLQKVLELKIVPKSYASFKQVAEGKKYLSELPTLLSSAHEQRLKKLNNDELRALLKQQEKDKIAKELIQQKVDVIKLAISQLFSRDLKAGDAVKIIRDIAKEKNQAEPVKEGLHLGVERLGRSNEVRFKVSAKGFGVGLGGYYKEDIGEELHFSEKGMEWGVTEPTFEPLYGKPDIPAIWSFATHVQLSPEVWTNVPIRVDVAKDFVTFVKSEGLQVEKDTRTGTIRAKGVGEVLFYQKVFAKKTPEEFAVKPAHSETYVELKSLNTELVTKISEIRDTLLPLRDKAILALSLHQQTFTYNDDPEVSRKVQTDVQNEAEFAKNLINFGEGTCNYAGTRACLILRLCGVPAYVEAGAVSTGKISTDAETHMWVKFWNGKTWEGGEATNGAINPNVRLHSSGFVSGNGEVKPLSQLVQLDSSPSVWSAAIKAEVISGLSEIAYLTVAVGAGTVLIPLSIVKLLANKESREKAMSTLKKNKAIVPFLMNALWLLALEKIEDTAHQAVEKQQKKLTPPENIE